MDIKTVFLSSTSKDLQEHRDAAYGAIEGLDGYHCVRMEDFGARHWDTDEFCRAKVAECDLFVGLVGVLHGSCPPGLKTSYTRREYQAAVDKEKPRLMFVTSDDFPIPAGITKETKEDQQRQERFQKQIRRSRPVPKFAKPNELAVLVLQAIYHWHLETYGEPLGSPLAPHYSHPYLMPKHWTGRRAEMEELDQWLRDDDHPLCCMVAMGGMGKSSLAWEWVTTRVEPEQADLGLEGIFQWSFYEGEVSFQGFTERLAEYLGIDAPRGEGEQVNLVDPLAQALDRRRVLLILDGFERLLRYYTTVDAAMKEEKTKEELPDHERQCAAPQVARFIRDITARSAAKTLLTTRLPPEELDDAANCQNTPLEGLDPEDAATFLRESGIDGEDRHLRQAAEVYGFHPLSLSRLVVVLRRNIDSPNDIRQAPDCDEKMDLTRRQQHILAQAYETLPEDLQQFLSSLTAALGRVDMEVVRLLAADHPDMDLSDALARLEEDLWITDRDANAVGFHPLVGKYAYGELKDKVGVHERLREYFEAAPAPGRDEVKSVEDLAPVIELYHHTVQAGRHDEARSLLRDRLIPNPLYFRFGAYQRCIELLRALFPAVGGAEYEPALAGEVSGPTPALPLLKDEAAQAWTLNALANSYSLSGQPRRAVPLFERQNELQEKAGSTKNLAIGLGNLADDQSKIGELAGAEESLRRSIELCREIGDEFWEAVGHQELGRVLAYRGEFGEAAEELGAALAAFEQQEKPQSQGIVWAYRALRALLGREAREGLEAAQRARELADETARTRYPHEPDFVRAEWVLGWARVALAQEEAENREEHLAEADEHLTEALERCRRINNVELEPDILLARARWRRASGAPAEARQVAEEALRIADRCEYRLNQADIHNLLARLALEEGDMERAREEAQNAKERAECDGKPHYYKVAYEEANDILRSAE